VVGAEDEGRVPVETEAFAGLDGSWPERGAFAGAEIDPAEIAALALGVDLIRIESVDAADETVAAADREPVFIDRADAGARAARAAPAAVVLQPAVHLVITARVDGDVIELAEGGLVKVVPVGAAIIADVG